MLRKFYILHFTFYIIFIPILLTLSCTSSTESQKANLSGKVILFDDTVDPAQVEADNSGIKIALYELAYLDTTIVRINNEYPQIGVQINQHTEFDHRFQEPVKYVETDAGGNFKLKNITPGEYNLVAMKDGWGWRYIYEISLSSGDNELGDVMQQSALNRKSVESQKIINDEFLMLNEKRSSNSKSKIQNSKLKQRNADISLFPVLSVPDDIPEYYNGELIIKPFHHLVVNEDFTLLEDSYFELQPNSVCRIAGGKSVDIYGTVKLQGEEDGMFTVTTNEGYNDFPAAIDSLTSDEMIRKIEIGQSAQIENEEIKWGSFSWLNNGIIFRAKTIVNNLKVNKSLVGMTINSELELYNVLMLNILEQAVLIKANSILENSLFIDCMYETILITDSVSSIVNTYFEECYFAIRLLGGSGSQIYNNCFNNIHVAIMPNACDPIINYNNFYDNEFSIRTARYYIGGDYVYCSPNLEISNNNFFSDKISISLLSSESIYGAPGTGIIGDLYTFSNFWKHSDILDELLIDATDVPEETSFYIVTQPQNQFISIAGIQ